jgi:SAM-dependent methyltransferase
MEREEGLDRLTYKDISAFNQHYIVTSFIVADIRAAIEQYAQGKLLDIGCGNKPYQSLFNGRIETYTGCDIIQSSQNAVDVICPANELAFADAIFDTAFSTQVLEHVADHQGMVRETYRILKKGGYAIFTVPFAWELHEEPYDFYRFSKHGLRDLFEKTGFEIISINSNGGKWASVFQLWLNVLFSTRRYNTLRSKIIKFIFIHLRFIVLYNKFSIWLDKKYFDDVLTLNYMVIARK